MEIQTDQILEMLHLAPNEDLEEIITESGRLLRTPPSRVTTKIVKACSSLGEELKWEFIFEKLKDKRLEEVEKILGGI